MLFPVSSGRQTEYWGRKLFRWREEGRGEEERKTGDGRRRKGRRRECREPSAAFFPILLR